MSKLSPAPKVKPRAQKKRFAARRDPACQAWIRAQPCRVNQRMIVDWRQGKFGDHTCWGPVQVCHVKSRGAGGSDHRNVVPLCAGAHDEQGRGIKSFERHWGLDLKAEAARLYQLYLAEGGRA